MTRELVHRLDLTTNTWLTDGAPTPKPVDDHVQVVWRDSLIYLITGWSGTQSSGTNVANVQIYDPAQDVWTIATSVPNNNTYKVFGASGAIIGDHIYYFGGAKISGFNFLSSTDLRIGIIDPNDPTSITWSNKNINIPGYRPASSVVNDQVYWLGGSDVTYNYDGIAYNGSGGVLPNQASTVYDPAIDNYKRLTTFPEMPMDLRGIGEINNTERILAGGMETGQKVSKKTWLLTWEENDILPVKELGKNESLTLFPNPVKVGKTLNIEIRNIAELTTMAIYDIEGKLIYEEELVGTEVVEMGWRAERAGVYFLKFGEEVKKLVVQ